mmetsp:Transcript_81950/g.232005  ORF Transcript_81950/g.232005 Transcript_81950/m.232005 type:complete len:254 (-) Transcript_81950:249-1010(-)
MTPRASVLCVALLGSVAPGLAAEKGGVSGFWQRIKQRAHDAVVSDTDVATVAEIVGEGRGIEARSCNGADAAMRIDSVSFDPKSLSIRVRGLLAREVAGGLVKLNVSLGKAPPRATVTERLRRTAAFVVGGRRSSSEDLCKHMGRHNRTCPLAAGTQELEFSLDRLPRVVVAGRYAVRVQAIDEAGLPVACVSGGLEVPRGKGGQLFRRVQATSTVPADGEISHGAARLGAQPGAAFAAALLLLLASLAAAGQ